MRSGLNVALKMAIIESQKHQRRIAALAKIDESRLSRIVSGRLEPTDLERERLSTVLGKPESTLFGEMF